MDPSLPATSCCNPTEGDLLVICPGCQNAYSSRDETAEHVRVKAYLLQVERMYEKLREVKEWLRAGAPGRALERAEARDKFEIERAASRLCIVIAKFDSDRLSDPNYGGQPLSVSDREVLAANILNELFDTKL